MLKDIKNTMDNINKVAKTVAAVSTAVSTTAVAVNNISKMAGGKQSETVDSIANGANKVSQIVESIVGKADMDYLAEKPTSELNNILVGMNSLLQGNNSKVEAMDSQVWYQRMLKTVTGTNKATLKEIRRNHDKLNGYMVEAVGELYNRNCIDQRMIISLGNEINSLYEKQIELREMLGMFATRLNEKIESIDNFHVLNVEIMQGVYSNMPSIEAICTILYQVDNRMLMDSRKMEVIARSLINSGIITDEKVKFKDYVENIRYVPEEKKSIIYMNHSGTRGNFISNIILNTFDNEKPLLEGEVAPTEFFECLIVEEDLHKEMEISSIEIFEDIVENKVNRLNGINPISRMQFNGLLSRGEEWFLQGNYKGAFEVFSLLAEKNVGRAMYFLGEIYDLGYGIIEENREKALEWRQRGSELEDPLCHLNYGLMLENQESRRDIFNESFNKILSLAMQGDIFSQNEVADMFANGYGTERDNKRYVYWLKNAGDKGHARALAKLGDCYLNGIGVDEDKNTSYVIYKRAAELGDRISQNYIANYYYNGTYEEQSYEEAVYWYEKSVEQGYHWACSNLGNCYRDGCGVEQDYTKAFELYMMAGNKGNDYAQHELGFAYYNDRGVKGNIGEGIKWYEKAANNGNINSMLNLGDWHGTGILKNKTKAFEYYKQAAEGGIARAQKELGNCYRDGKGTKKNYEEAVRWYEKSVEQGFAPAMTNLGYAYYEGQGVKKDKEVSFYWYRKGAIAGSKISQYALADMYYNGDGTQKNLEKAKKWYIESAKQGLKEAKKKLKKYYKVELKK